MKRISSLLGMGMALWFAACTEQEPPKAVAPKPTPAPAPPKPVDAAATDARKLGMMERYAIWKAQKEADEKLAKQLAEEEAARLRKFDKKNLAKHTKLLAFEKKLRRDFDAAAEKLKGKPDGAEQIVSLGEKQRKAIEKQAALLRKMDPRGDSSNIGTDHDVSLNLLANDYPAALAAAAKGDDQPLADVRKELDKRFAKMDSWLAEVKTSKDQPTKTGGKGKKGKKGKK